MSSEKTTSGKAASDFRLFLKDTIRKEVDFSLTDQSRGIEAPAIEKPCAPDARRVDLPKQGTWQIPARDLETAIGNRRSHRIFTRESLSLDELAFLLWATQGIRGPLKAGSNLRTVPSAGCRHAFETYSQPNKMKREEIEENERIYREEFHDGTKLYFVR